MSELMQAQCTDECLETTWCGLKVGHGGICDDSRDYTHIPTDPRCTYHKPPKTRMDWQVFFFDKGRPCRPCRMEGGADE